MTQQIPLLGIYSEKTIIEKSMYTNVHCGSIYRHRSNLDILTGECIEKLWYMYSGILLNHKEECIWASANEVDGPRPYYAVK